MIETLSAAVELLLETDIDRMVDSAVRAEYLELSRAADRIDHRRARLLAAIHHRGIPFEHGASSTPAWVQYNTGQRKGEARASLEAGLACETLPLTAKAWAQGEISASAARAICEGRPEGFEDAYGEVEETLVGYASDRNWRDLRATISHCRRCADALDEREPADRNGLHLSKITDRWAVTGDFDDLGGTTVDQAVTSAVDNPSPDDLRSTSKRKADALVYICRYFLDHADLPIEGAESPHVTVGVSYETARAAPRPLRRAIVARDKCCRFPGCDRKPQRCKAHHVDPWLPDGETKACNCVLLCQYHHGVVHRPGWNDTFDGITYTVIQPNGEPLGIT